VIPVGAAGTIHYQLASLPFTSGSFLGMDLDVSSHRAAGPCEQDCGVVPVRLCTLIPREQSSSPGTTPWGSWADDVFWKR